MNNVRIALPAPAAWTAGEHDDRAKIVKFPSIDATTPKFP
jgi:hypothetical protein